MTNPIAGSPDALAAQTRAIRRLAGAMRGHAGGTSRTVGGQVSTWQGTGSMAYASQAGQHSRAAGSGATHLERTCDDVDGFARQVTRLQGEADRHLARHDRLQLELRNLQRDSRVEWRTSTPAERRDLQRLIEDKRGAIAREVTALDRLAGELARARGQLYRQISTALPPDVRAWWEKTREFTDTVTTARDGAGQVRGGIGYLRDTRLAKDALATGTPQEVVARLRSAHASFQRAIPEGDIVGTKGLKLLKPVWDSRLGQFVLRSMAPGAVDLIASGVHDVATGSDYEGARGTADRVAGGVAITAGVLVLLKVDPRAPAALATAYGAWKVGNVAYDHRNPVDRALHRATGRAAKGEARLSDSAARALDRTSAPGRPVEAPRTLPTAPSAHGPSSYTSGSGCAPAHGSAPAGPRPAPWLSPPGIWPPQPGTTVRPVTPAAPTPTGRLLELLTPPVLRPMTRTP